MKTRNPVLPAQYNSKCFLWCHDDDKNNLAILFFNKKYKLIFEKVSFMCVIFCFHMKIFSIISLFMGGLFFLSSCDWNGQKKPNKNLLTDSIQTGTIVYPNESSVDYKEFNYERVAMIDSIIDKYVSRRQFNGVVLVGDKGAIIYQGVKGFGNHMTAEPLTLTTSFHLASVSKQFTSVAVMMLEEEGKLSYTDTVGRYIENFPYKDITIHQLLNHTSGLPDISEYIPQFLGFWDTCKIAVNNDIPWILSNLKPSVKFLPGRRFSYSNTGYIILALIVERVSGLTYGDFLKQRIFDPLQMNHTFVYNYSDFSGCPVTAKAYTTYKYSYVPFEDDIRNGLVGEKGVYSSATDLFKWDQALYGYQLLSQQTIDKAFSRGELVNGKQIDYGYGWRIPRKADNIVYHFGYWKGSRAAFIRVLDKQYTIIILNNTSSKKIRTIVREILDILYMNADDKPVF